MENEKLLTKKELAARWQVTTTAINNWIRDGALSPCKVPGDTRFSLQYITKLEGTEINPMSPLERRRLEHELKETKEKLNYYEKLFTQLKIMTDKVQLQQLMEVQQC